MRSKSETVWLCEVICNIELIQIDQLVHISVVCIAISVLDSLYERMSFTKKRYWLASFLHFLLVLPVLLINLVIIMKRNSVPSLHYTISSYMHVHFLQYLKVSLAWQRACITTTLPKGSAYSTSPLGLNAPWALVDKLGISYRHCGPSNAHTLRCICCT